MAFLSLLGQGQFHQPAEAEEAVHKTEAQTGRASRIRERHCNRSTNPTKSSNTGSTPAIVVRDVEPPSDGAGKLLLPAV